MNQWLSLTSKHLEPEATIWINDGVLAWVMMFHKSASVAAHQVTLLIRAFGNTHSISLPYLGVVGFECSEAKGALSTYG